MNVKKVHFSQPETTTGVAKAFTGNSGRRNSFKLRIN